MNKFFKIIKTKRLDLIPYYERSYEICMDCVQKDGLYLQFVPENHKSNDMCLAAVRQNGLALQFVPLNMRTIKICCIAVEKNNKAIEYMFENKDLIQYIIIDSFDSVLIEKLNEYLHNNGKSDSDFDYVNHITKQRYINDISIDIRSFYKLENITTEKMIDLLMSLIELRGNKYLRYVPEILLDTILNMLDFELSKTKYVNEYINLQECEIMVKKNGINLKKVPITFRTDDICWLAINENYNAFEFVPFAKRTYKMCEYVVRKNGELIRFVPSEHRTWNLCYIASIQNKKAIKYMSYTMSSIVKDMHKIKKYKFNLRCINNKIKVIKEYNDYDDISIDNVKIIADWIIENNPESIIPLVEANCILMSEEKIIVICKDFVSKNPKNIKKLSNKYKTDEINFCAVEQDGMMIKRCYNPSLKVCITAVKQNIKALKFVPKEYYDSVLREI
jgi:hypothetical protein